MHRLDSMGPARAGRSRSRLGRTAALVGGCSLAVAAAFALPAFAGGSAPPEQEDAVVIGCAIGEDAEAAVPAPVGPLPKGAEVVEGRAVPVTGSVTVPDGVTPAMPLPKGAKAIVVDVPSAGDAEAVGALPKGAKVVEGRAVPVTGSTTVPEGGTPAMPLPKGAKAIVVDVTAGPKGGLVVSGPRDAAAPAGAEVVTFVVDAADLPDCGTAAK